MITKEKNRTKIICAVVTAISAIVAGGSAFQLHNVQNISQTVNGNVIQVLGETGSYVSAGTDLTDSTDELISAYRKVLDENSQYQANQLTFLNRCKRTRQNIMPTPLPRKSALSLCRKRCVGRP